jgi:hypothetical protein
MFAALLLVADVPIETGNVDQPGKVYLRMYKQSTGSIARVIGGLRSREL